LFTKKPPTTEKIITEETLILSNAIDVEEIYAQIEETVDEKVREELINKIARQVVAKEILDYVDSEKRNTPEKKTGRKRLFELHELRFELQKLEEQKAKLQINKSKISHVVQDDTEIFDTRINNLFALLSKNKINDIVELSDFQVTAFDKDCKQLERLLIDKSTLRRHKTREQVTRRQKELYESNIKKELINLDTLIGQNKLEEAKKQASALSIKIKPDYKKGIERLARSLIKIKEKEIEFYKKRQTDLLREQEEEADRVRIQYERKLEQHKIVLEQAVAIKKIEEAKIEEKKNRLNSLLAKKFNWRDFQRILQENGIGGLFHFTDKSNLKSIKANGGLFSWYYCDMNRIEIPMPGGSTGSRLNDTTNGKKDFVRVAFNKEHPMLHIALKDGRISEPIWLDIDIEVAYFENTEFSDKNAAAFSSYKPIIGKEVMHLSNIRFDILKKAEKVKHYNLPESEKPFNQAELLVKTWIPIDYIKNIEKIY